MGYTKYHKLELTEVLRTNVVKGKGKHEKDETPPLPKTLPLLEIQPLRNGEPQIFFKDKLVSIASDIQVTMKATLKPKKRATRNWLDLPSDVMMNILQRLNVLEIVLNVQRVCTNWRQICKDPCMWRVVYLDTDFNNVRRRSSVLPFTSMAMHEICKNLVDRSQGQLVDITIVGFCDGKLLQNIAKRSSQLRRLKIAWGMYFSYHLSKALKKFPLLEELILHSIQIPEGEIQTLGRDCPMLKTLKLTNQSGYKDDALGLAIAENLPWLRHLELTWCNLSDAGLRAILDRCRHLQVLYLQKCYPVDLRGELGKRCSQQIKDVKFTPRFYLN